MIFCRPKNGIEALKIACEKKPDLILMDIQLSEVSGLEVTEWIKEDENISSIPVIAVTAFAMKGDEKNSVTVAAKLISPSLHLWMASFPRLSGF